MSDLIHPFLTGKVVYLRGLQASDVDSRWLDWFNDQENTYYMHNGIFPTSREGHLEFYEQVRRSQTDLVLAICMKEDNRHVGNLGLHRIDHLNRKAELGIVVGDRTIHGKGVAAEAMKLIMAHGFNRLNLHKIWLRVDENNLPARRAFEKAGFRDEGVLRDELYHHRRWSASVYMGVLEEDFFTKFPEMTAREPGGKA